MSSQQVNTLRKEGKLREAYLLAKQDLTQMPDDLWAQRAMAWVLYEYLKQEVGQSELFCRVLQQIVTLDLRTEETMFYEKIAWVLARHLDYDKAQFPIAYQQCFPLFQQLHFTPSDGYTYLLRTVHTHRNEWDGYLAFCTWWNLDNLRPEDYEYQVSASKQRYMSVAEQVYIAFAKANIQQGSAEEKAACLKQLERVNEEHPEYAYILYYRAQLLLSLERKEEAFQLLLPFVMQKQNDYWVWQILGDAASDDSLTFSCYSKALTCRTKPEMSVRLKARYAEMLLRRGMLAEAKLEIQQVVAVRQQNGWSIPFDLSALMNEPWFATTTAIQHNNRIYRQFAKEAEDALLFSLKQKHILITSLNEEKGIANFTTCELKTGFFGYRRMKGEKPIPGKMYKAYFKEFAETKASLVACLQPCRDDSLWEPMTTSFTGKLCVADNKRYAIVYADVGQVFVPPFWLKRFTNSKQVTGRAIKSFDKMKNKWGWTMYQTTEKQ